MWTVTTPWFLPFIMLSLRDDAFTRARDHFNTEITTELSVPVQSVRGVGGETWDSEEILTDYSTGTVAPPVVVDEYAVEKKANDSCQGVDQHRECLAIAVKVMASSMEREVEGLQRIVETVGISDLGGNNISTRANRTSTCLYPLQVLDFLHDWSDPNLLEASWPCETRAYWSKQLLPLVSLVRFLFTYVAPLMVVLGLVVNSLSFVVLNTPPLNTTNLSVYLRALALTDNSTLLVNVAMSLARAHIPAVSRLYTNNQWMCATNKVFMGTLYHYSTWLVVALTWARLFTIKYPLSLGWCSDRVAIYVVTALGVAFITLSGMRVRYPGFEQDSVFEYEPCQINVSVSRGTNMNSAVFVYLTLSLWLPLTLILIGQPMPTYRGETISEDQVYTHRNVVVSAIRKKSLPPLDTFKLTRMLSLVSSAYLILLLPLGVAATLEIYWDVVIKKSPALEGPARLIYLNCDNAVAKVFGNETGTRASDNVTGTRASDNVTNPRASGNVTDTRASDNVTNPRASGNVTGTRASDNETNPRASGNVTGTRASDNVTNPRASDNVTGTRASDNVTNPRASDNVTGTRASDNVTNPRASDNVTGTRASDNVTNPRASDNVTGTRASDNVTNPRASDNVTGTRASDNVTNPRASDNVTGTRASDNVTNPRASDNVTGTRASDNVTNPRASDNVTGTRASDNVTSTRASGNVTGTRASGNVTGTRASGHGISMDVLVLMAIFLTVHRLKRKLLFKWIRGLCYFVYLFHFCINFFLYCISGQKFRRVVIHHIRGALPLGMSRFFCREDARTSGSTPFTLTKKGDRRPSPTNSGPSSQTVAHPASSSHPSKCGYVNEAFTLKECVSPL
uniref:G-protein coupled receptors family 1 profile domain-containing protein n=1 Tax=Timema cristinae TaxID=61476 RepID=A0A7R9CQM2_TIMCR|nr:unnamed protein product [Timema cristinae]